MLPRHRFRGQAATRAAFPALRRSFRFSATYNDAWISHPERLGIELIGDAVAQNAGALALNHARLTQVDGGLTLTDGDAGRALPLGARQAEWLVSGTKGSHLILDNPALLASLDGHMIYCEHDDGRVCIVFPYLGRVLVGSTDLRVDKPGRTACSLEERDDILGALQGLFPGVPVTAGQIVYAYAGFRPLPVSDADFTGRISRGHAVRRLPGPVPQIGMVGGKWTTYRAFAEETVDLVLADLGLRRRASTRDMAIGGGAGYSPGLAADLVAEGLAPERAAHLVDLYGARAAAVAAFCGTGDPALPGVPMTEG
jgi:glycerol-3-phosphate dehydrogenase